MLLPVPVGPELEAQLIPDTPVIDQVAVPVGVAPPLGPVTVAVKVKVDPSVVVGVEVATVAFGVILVMVKEKVVLGPAMV